MAVVLIILGVLLSIAIAIIIILNLALEKSVSMLLEADPKTAFDLYYDEKNIEQTYLCDLFVMQNNSIKQNELCFDFSKYEFNNIIVVHINSEELEDGSFTILPNQKVYKMKDGGFVWDIRHYF